MNNEETRLINDSSISDIHQQPAAATGIRQKGNGTKAAAAGFAAGAAVGTAATATANNLNENEAITPDIAAEEEAQPTSDNTAATTENTEQDMAAPNPEQVILANDEGIRFAHVDGTTFNEAFAQARAQVGPGGVFEYDGRLYGTYYADEWNSMTSQERADYQNRVSEVVPSHHSETTHNAYLADNTPETIPTNVEMIAEEPADNEIRVLGVETVQDDHGRIMNVALVENNGDQALLVDVDNDGTIDVLLHDDNHDGELQQSEIHDISGAGLDFADLVQSQYANEANSFYAANDDMPDYMNDADLTMDV